MQSTGHTSTHALSFVPMHGSQMIYATQVSWIPTSPGGRIRPGKYTPEVRPAALHIAGAIVAGFTARVTLYGRRNEKTVVPQVGYDPPQFHVRF